MLEQRDRCPDCGWPRHLTFDEKLSRKWLADRWTCFACKHKETRAKNAVDSKSDLTGAKFSVQRVR